jgi:ADP-ribose pyrophosphatase
VEEAVRLLLPSLSHTPAPHTLDKRTLRDLMIVFSMAKAESLETSILNAVVASCKLRTDADIERRKLARRAVKVPQPVGSLEQPAKPPVHLKARDRDRYVGADCPEGVRRLPIADESLVPWEADWTAAGGYHPPTYEHPVLTKFCNHGATREERRAHAKAKWADPPAPLSSDLIAEVLSRKTYETKGVLLWDHEKRLPLNPRGRTGLAGRGLLGKWGPNHAADPIVTRLHPTTNQLQMVAIERADQPGVWALPGGMVDEGETVSETVQREFRAEVGNIPDPEGQRLFEEATGRLFASGGTVVYRGYVDDPRTTDHAWIETTAFHFHCPPEIGAPLASNLGPISPPISAQSRLQSRFQSRPNLAPNLASQETSSRSAQAMTPRAPSGSTSTRCPRTGMRTCTRATGSLSIEWRRRSRRTSERAYDPRPIGIRPASKCPTRRCLGPCPSLDTLRRTTPTRL